MKKVPSFLLRCLLNCGRVSIFAPQSRTKASQIGRLAQLVQSVCLTSRGSGVRIPQRPHTKKRLRRVASFFIPSRFDSELRCGVRDARERERGYANFSACLISFRRKCLHNVAGEWGSANAPTGILTACQRNKKGYAPRKSAALYAVEKEQSADEPGSVLCVAKCSSFIWMCRCRHILSFYPPTFLRGAIGRAALRRRFT